LLSPDSGQSKTDSGTPYIKPELYSKMSDPSLKMAEEFDIAAFRFIDYISLNISRNSFLDMPIIHRIRVLFIIMISLILCKSTYPRKGQIVPLHELVNFITPDL